MPQTTRSSKEQDTPQSLEKSRRFQYIRAFNDIDSAIPLTKEELGGKGLGLVELTQLELPVPPGFIVTTDGWRAFHRANDTIPEHLWQKTVAGLQKLEEKTGRRFNDPDHPLFVSVRSGGPMSMPGAMKTILNIGLNETTVHALATQIGEKAALVAYYHLVKQFTTDICHVDMSLIETVKNTTKYALAVERIHELPAPFLRTLIDISKARVALLCEPFPQDPKEQLKRAIHEVFASWNSPDAITYRQTFGIPEHLGTAVTVQQMVWGISEGEGSGSGVLLTRDPQTLGEAVVGFLPHRQGKAVVEDKAHAEMHIHELPISDWAKQELFRWKEILESYHGFPSDIEFTIEVDPRGGEHAYILQDRKERLTNPAYVLWLFEQMQSGASTEPEAMRLATQRTLYSILDYDLDPIAMEEARTNDEVIATGQPIANGHASGPIVFSVEEAQKQHLSDVILMAPKKMKVDLLKLPSNVKGVFTHSGGIGAHSGRNAARLDIPVIFNGHKRKNFQLGDMVTLNGTTGEVFARIIPLAEKPGSSLLTEKQLEMVKSWNEKRTENPWRFLVAPDSEATIEKIVDDATQPLREKIALARSRKAKVEHAFIDLIPSDIRMQYDIRQKDDVRGIRSRVEEILTEGFDATLRTGHFPDIQGGKGPWINLTNTGELEEFFSNLEFPSKYGGFSVWTKDTALTEILVGRVPKDKLNPDPEIARQHCAWTLSCGQNNELIIQVHPHDPHVRELDDEKNDDALITYTIPVNVRTGELYPNAVIDIGEVLVNDTLALDLGTLVEKTLRQWYSKYELPHRLAAIAEFFPLRENFSTPALQGQARIYPNGSSWVLSYDINNDPLI